MTLGLHQSLDVLVLVLEQLLQGGLVLVRLSDLLGVLENLAVLNLEVVL